MWIMSEEEKVKVVEAYQRGDSMSKICRDFNKPTEIYSVKCLINQLDIKKVYQPVNEDKVVQLYQNGYNLKKIKKIMDEDGCKIGQRGLIKILKAHNISIKTNSDYIKIYHCNEDKFSGYDKFSCYWARLLAADGCVFSRHKNGEPTEFTIGLKDDYDTVKGLQDYLEYNGKIYEKKSNYDDSITYTLTVNCKAVVDSLINNFNIVPRKTLIYNPPQNIPENLQKYFLLGYIDGDGSLTYYSGIKNHVPEWKGFNLNITGTLEMIEFTRKVLNKPNIKAFQRRPERHKNNWTLNIQGNEQLYNILSWIYDDEEINCICMQRKYNNWLILKSQIEEKRNNEK